MVVQASKSINCPACGAPVTLRALGASVMVACPSCRSQIDVSTPDIQIIKKFKAAAQRFDLPLGARGRLRGNTYVIVGAMVRSNGGFQWQEFLLFNPYIGFRWLICDQGHWSLAATIKDVSAIVSSGPGSPTVAGITGNSRPAPRRSSRWSASSTGA